MRYDCGFEAVGDDVEKLTGAAQAHARTCQGAQLSDEVTARLIGRGKSRVVSGSRAAFPCRLLRCRRHRDGHRGFEVGRGTMGYTPTVTGSVLLLIGYPLALGVLARLRSVLAGRRLWCFAALEAATVIIAAGWLLHGRLLPAAVNGAAFVGFAIAWLVTGPRVGLLARNVD